MRWFGLSLAVAISAVLVSDHVLHVKAVDVQHKGNKILNGKFRKGQIKEKISKFASELGIELPKPRKNGLQVWSEGHAMKIMSKLNEVDECSEELIGKNFPSKHFDTFKKALANGKLFFDFQNFSQSQILLRQCLFLQAEEHISALNARNGTKARFAHNKFSVLSTEEFHAMYGGLVNVTVRPKPKSSPESDNVLFTKLGARQSGKGGDQSSSSSIPTAFSWVGTAVPKLAEDQGHCGSCWAFSASQTVMAMNWITEKNGGSNPKTPPEELSAQQLVSCDTASIGCNGGNYEAVWDSENGYTVNHMLNSANAVPYVSGKKGYVPNCPGKEKEGVTASENIKVGGPYAATNDDLVKQLQINPMSISIFANTPCFQQYESGILTYKDCEKYMVGALPECKKVDHAVFLTGYKNYGSKDFAFEIKNSWGSSWGEQGYIYFAADNHGVKSSCSGLLSMNGAPAFPKNVKQFGDF